MNKISRTLPVLSIALIIAVVSGIASAQTIDVFWTNYFSNVVPGAPIPSLRITNPGVVAGNRGSFGKPGPGSLCAMVYAFESDQQLAACCGCLVTPNGLQTSGTLGSTLTGRVPVDGVVQVVSAAPNSTASATAVSPNNSPFCDPTTAYTPTPDLRVWLTHIQNHITGATGQGAFPETETHSLPAPLSANEEGWLQGNCNFLAIQGSGQGICDCGPFEK